jgi:hypothetical protein
LSNYEPQEYELLRLARIIGGKAKTKELLESINDHKISIDTLLTYMKSVDYKIPSPLENRVRELERRISTLEGKPEQPEEEPKQPISHVPKLKEWSDKELKDYLDECRKWHEPTCLYYKILSGSDGKIRREDLIAKIQALSGKAFTGYSLAGVLTGITKSIENQNYERLDIKDEDSENFSLNEKYKEKIRSYFESS